MMTKKAPHIEEESNWYVYILHCSDGSFYTGVTTDMKRRLNEHNSSKKGARYTRSRQPVQLVYIESAKSRSSALQREHVIKKMDHLTKHSLVVSSQTRAGGSQYYF